MFGILYSTMSLIAKSVVNIRDISYDYKSKNKAKFENKETYFDHNGAKRLISDNRQIYTTTNHNNDRIIKDIDGKVLKNLDISTREKRIKKTNEMLGINNAPVICLGYFYDLYNDKEREKELLKWIPKRQKVYQSLKNGNKYIREKTKSNNLPEYIYINLNNGDYEFLDDYSEIANKWLKNRNKYKSDSIIVKGVD